MKRRALLFFLLVNVLLISCSKNKSSEEDSHFLIFGFEKSKQDSLIHLEGNYIYSDDLDNSNVLVSYVEPFLSKEINRCVVFCKNGYYLFFSKDEFEEWARNKCNMEDECVSFPLSIFDENGGVKRNSNH